MQLSTQLRQRAKRMTKSNCKSKTQNWKYSYSLEWMKTCSKKRLIMTIHKFSRKWLLIDMIYIWNSHYWRKHFHPHMHFFLNSDLNIHISLTTTNRMTEHTVLNIIRRSIELDSRVKAAQAKSYLDNPKFYLALEDMITTTREDNTEEFWKTVQSWVMFHLGE